MSSSEDSETESEVLYFAHSASMRVYADKLTQELIASQTGLVPTASGIRGEPRPNTLRLWGLDLWEFASPLAEDCDLTMHLMWLWKALEPHKAFFLALQQKGVAMDLFCGYRSNCDHAGVDIESQALRLSTEFNLRLCLSVIVS